MGERSFSFEFFPPRSEKGWASLRETVHALAPLKPEFASVTFGAGGSTQDGTRDAVLGIREEFGLNAVPHLSCMGSTSASISEFLNAYREAGINRIVALRGDLPSGVVDPGAFRYANELVDFIRSEHGDWFTIEVAAYPETHPQARTPDRDLDNFVRKVQAGANGAITQYFFNADAYFDFCERVRARGLNIPITPGIMPITNYHQLVRFSDACGAEVPRWIRQRLEALADDLPSLRDFGLDVINGLCERLLEGGAPGLHVYTLNKADTTLKLWDRLKF